MDGGVQGLAMAYVHHLGLWVVVNDKTDPIVYAQDQNEAMNLLLLIDTLQQEAMGKDLRKASRLLALKKARDVRALMRRQKQTRLEKKTELPIINNIGADVVLPVALQSHRRSHR